MAAFETNTYACGGMALAVFQMITFPCGGTALAAFDVNPLHFEAGQHWWNLRLTHTLVAGISDDHIPLWRAVLAAFEVNPLPFEAGRRWRHL